MSVFHPQFAMYEIKGVLKRRWFLILLPVILVTGLSYLVAHTLTPMYKSSISMLVQQDQTLNPLVSYEMGVSLASQDRLSSFNEIIYSRSTAEMLIDSLKLQKKDSTAKDFLNHEELIKKVRKNIATQLKASDSFDISYYDSDPFRAKEAVVLLSNYFINTRELMQNKQNSETVDFFEKKVREFEKKVEEEEGQQISNIKNKIQNNPVEVGALQSQLQKVSDQIGSTEDQIRTYKTQLNELDSLSTNLSNPDDIRKLYLLDFNSIPEGPNLQSKLTEYSQLVQTFTPKYPQVRELRLQIAAIVQRIPETIRYRVNLANNQLANLQSYKQMLTNDIEKQYVTNTDDGISKSNYQIYQNLYSEMKVKLEQARVTQELGKGSVNKFVVIDPPVVPVKPSKPNRPLLEIGGFIIGLFLGIISGGVAELMDTTIRTAEDLRFYRKPIIAYLSDGELE